MDVTLPPPTPQSPDPDDIPSTYDIMECWVDWSVARDNSWETGLDYHEQRFNVWLHRVEEAAVRKYVEEQESN